MAFNHHVGTGSLILRLSGQVEPAPDRLDLGNGRCVEAYDLGNFQARSFLPFYMVSEGDDEKSYNWGQYRLFHILFSDPRNHYVYMNLDFPPMEVIDERPGFYIFQIDSPRYDDVDCRVLWGSSSAPGMNEPEWCVAGSQFFMGMKTSKAGDGPALHNSSSPDDDSPIPVDLLFVEWPGPAKELQLKSVLQEGVVKGRFSMSMMPESANVAVAGCEGIHVTSCDVDVATGAAVPNPNVSTFLDGALVHVKHVRNLQHTLSPDSVEARICLHQLKELVSSDDLGGHGDILGLIDQYRFEQGYISNEFPVDGKTHLLGVFTGEREEQQKSIYVVACAGRK